MSGRQTIKGEYIQLLADNPIIGPTSTRMIPSVTSTFMEVATTTLLMIPAAFTYTLGAGITQNVVMGTISQTPKYPSDKRPDNTVALGTITSTNGKEVRLLGGVPRTAAWRGIFEVNAVTDSATTAAAAAGYNAPNLAIKLEFFSDLGGGAASYGAFNQNPTIIAFAAGAAGDAKATVPFEFLIPDVGATPTEQYIHVTVTNHSDKNVVITPVLRFIVSAD